MKFDRSLEKFSRISKLPMFWCQPSCLAMSEPDKLLKSPKGDRYFSHPHYKEEKQKQKCAWKRRQKEKKVRQKREKRRKTRARGKNAKDNVEDVQHNFPNKKDETTSVQVDLADESAGQEWPHKHGVNKSGQNSSKADKAREREKEGRRRGVQLGLEYSKGQQMIKISLKRKTPEISTKLDDQPCIFSKSSRVDKSTQRATTMTPDQKKNLLPALWEICPLLLNKTSEPIGSGTFGAVFLAEYRGIKRAVKEMKQQKDSPKETERYRHEELHEAQILKSLRDHPNLTLLFGACTTIEPFCLVLQFHGIGEKSTTLHEVLKKRLLKRNSTARVLLNCQNS